MRMKWVDGDDKDEFLKTCKSGRGGPLPRCKQISLVRAQMCWKHILKIFFSSLSSHSQELFRCVAWQKVRFCQFSRSRMSQMKTYSQRTRGRWTLKRYISSSPWQAWDHYRQQHRHWQHLQLTPGSTIPAFFAAPMNSVWNTDLFWAAYSIEYLPCKFEENGKRAHQ